MIRTSILSQRRFWAGAFPLVLGLAALVLCRALELGTLRAPGPGAFPMALALAALLFGGTLIFRAAKQPPSAPAGTGVFWSSPLAMIAATIALLAVALAFLGPITPYFERVGPAVLFSWYALVLALAAAAGAVAEAPARALGALLVGLLLGTSGIDTLTPGVARNASVELGLSLTFVHGLLLAFIAHHVGFNALLIAVAAALSGKFEKALREALASDSVGFSTIADQSIGVALLVAAAAVLALGTWLGRRHSAAVSAALPDEAAAEAAFAPAQPAFWAGALALAAGGAGLYFGAGIGLRSADPDGVFGPGAAPMALSGLLVLLGAGLTLRTVWRPDAAVQRPWRSPASVGAIVILSVLALLLFAAPIAAFALNIPFTDFIAGFGPAETTALIVFIATSCVAAAWLLPHGSLLRALGAIAIGFLLGTIGLDPITGVVRYLPHPNFQLAHGLALGFVAYRVGFNPLLIIVGFAYSELLEGVVRQSLLISRGDLTIFAHSRIGVGLLGASAAILIAGSWLTAVSRRAAPAAAANPGASERP